MVVLLGTVIQRSYCPVCEKPQTDTPASTEPRKGSVEAGARWRSNSDLSEDGRSVEAGVAEAFCAEDDEGADVEAKGLDVTELFAPSQTALILYLSRRTVIEGEISRS